MNFKPQEQKVTEAACYLLQKHGGNMPYLQLIKLLYLADRSALEKWERPITNDRYCSMDNGPVLSTTYDMIMRRAPENGDFWAKYISKPSQYHLSLTSEKIHFQKLSSAEMAMVDEIDQKFGYIDQWKLVEYTHTLPEYDHPHGSSKTIPLYKILMP